MWGSARWGNSPCAAFWFWHHTVRSSILNLKTRTRYSHVHVILPSLTMTTPHSRSRSLFPMADTADRNEAEPSDISSALDVEQLDLNLYRSRNLSLNFDARGVFGGQVISQALVAATNCVKPEFTLHVRVPLPPCTPRCIKP